VKVWRLCSSRHVKAAYSGEGARRYGGRWNPPGFPIVYCSGSLSLAVLESLVHFDVSEFPNDFVSLSASIPDTITPLRYTSGQLPKGWRSYGMRRDLQAIGQRWVEQSEHLMLAVPSAIVPEETNYLLNPQHADFHWVKVGKPVPFTFDERLIP